jgi:Domain of unknown function (DUF4190)
MSSEQPPEDAPRAPANAQPLGRPRGQPSGEPPGQPYPTPYPPYGYAPPINMYSILALVFGVMVFPPLGIYFGRKAKQQIAQTGERGIELATAGQIVGWIFTGIWGLLVLVSCGFLAAAIVGSSLGR